jgi:hypothetical protein
VPALGLAAIHVVPPGDLDRHLVRLCPACDESHTGEPSRGKTGKLVRQLFLERVCQPLVVHVRELRCLCLRDGDDVAPPVTERRGHRPTTHGVEVPLA